MLSETNNLFVLAFYLNHPPSLSTSNDGRWHKVKTTKTKIKNDGNTAKIIGNPGNLEHRLIWNTP
jgi:hypothetical protein